MSGSSRPRRTATVGINYREPGDDPELSDSDDSVASAASSDTGLSGLDSVLDSSFVLDFSWPEETYIDV